MAAAILDHMTNKYYTNFDILTFLNIFCLLNLIDRMQVEHVYNAISK